MNCPFYFKIGACRHGDQCSRTHNRPVISQTLLLKNMYQNLPASIALAEGQTVEDAQIDEAQDHFESFYEEGKKKLCKEDALALVFRLQDSRRACLSSTRNFSGV